jgi:hypothetical protein
MDYPKPADALSALAQESRLSIYRLLVEAGPEACPRGASERR